MTTYALDNATVSASRPPALLAGDVLDLIDRSRASLLEACHATTGAERYAAAQMGALRACAALLGHIAPRAVGSRPRSAWQTLRQHLPECSEWADFFEISGRRSRSVQAGLTRVTAREADDLVRQSEAFLDQVLVKLGLPPAAPVTSNIAPVALR